MKDKTYSDWLCFPFPKLHVVTFGFAFELVDAECELPFDFCALAVSLPICQQQGRKGGLPNDNNTKSCLDRVQYFYKKKEWIHGGSECQFSSERMLTWHWHSSDEGERRVPVCSFEKYPLEWSHTNTTQRQFCVDLDKPYSSVGKCWRNVSCPNPSSSDRTEGDDVDCRRGKFNKGTFNHNMLRAHSCSLPSIFISSVVSLVKYYELLNTFQVWRHSIPNRPENKHFSNENKRGACLGLINWIRIRNPILAPGS